MDGILSTKPMSHFTPKKKYAVYKIRKFQPKYGTTIVAELENKFAIFLPGRIIQVFEDAQCEDTFERVQEAAQKDKLYLYYIGGQGGASPRGGSCAGFPNGGLRDDGGRGNDGPRRGDGARDSYGACHDGGRDDRPRRGDGARDSYDPCRGDGARCGDALCGDVARCSDTFQGDGNAFHRDGGGASGVDGLTGDDFPGDDRVDSRFHSNMKKTDGNHSSSTGNVNCGKLGRRHRNLRYNNEVALQYNDTNNGHMHIVETTQHSFPVN
ncbi:PE-PGRS family protein PE_PGRS16-like [Belonocnema kinseyi]|uniref:PE-PGRS family protein PE_PGRS16-like n=1 Tax=Belonocnema kinseyi TaxID=2817044 RepID=UPI00143D93E0|nr:PE-PGRS family protein PE_PGRS16-like [Belonocnema kinseyi]